MRPVIGFNYGAKEYGRVKQIFRTVLVMTAAIMVVGTVLCLVIPGQLIGLLPRMQLLLLPVKQRCESSAAGSLCPPYR